MQIVELNELKQSKLMMDYATNEKHIQAFFDYRFCDQGNFSERKNELLTRNFQRSAIKKRLETFNQKYNCSIETMANINKLSEPNSVVIVGGQQAGVLTGPLYTIHKMITIIQLAKQQEEKLGSPVVPIFWIAGEDHDFDEINHIFSIDVNKLQKRKVEQLNDRKQSISDISIDKEALKNFIVEVLRDLNETKYTVELKDEINRMLELSNSYVDFFSFFIHKLFKTSGIVLLDAHDKEIRKLQIPFLKQLIKKNDQINDSFLQMANSLYNSGYGEPIERSENTAHLFYHYRGSRLLLERTSCGSFTDKKGIVSFSEQQLLELVETEPHHFSNNVVTRPLMQEFLLPVLGFVAGPGEVAYWATLKDVFHSFAFKVPPVIPRISLTVVEPQIEKYLKQIEAEANDVIQYGTTKFRNSTTFATEIEKIEKTLHEALCNFEQIHQPLKDLVTNYDQGLEKMAHKNELIIKRELTFLARKLEKSVRQKYDFELLKFDLVDINLFPNSGLQERSLNITKYVNEYGFDFVERLIEQPFLLNSKHKLIYVN